MLSRRMGNEFYRQDDQRGARVNALFARIARRYDFINDLQSFGLHRFWKRRVVELAQIKPGTQVLDVCCGTGDIAIQAAAAGGIVVGLDFTPAMLDVARHRPASFERRAGKISFIEGDALKLPFEDQSFAVVTVGYGLRNLSNWKVGLHEMLRVAQPGGRLLVLEFGKPDCPPWRWIYFTYLKAVVPLLGWAFAGSAAAYAYILESLKHYPGQRGVEREMRELGMHNVRVVNFLGGVMSINYGEKPAVAAASHSLKTHLGKRS